MKQVFLWVLASFCCFVSSGTRVYYIAPTQPDCNVNDTTLNPCYTLQQLIVNGNFSLSTSVEESVELLFLPGAHLMPEKKTLNVTNFIEVMIHPWKVELEVVIDYEDTR